MSASPPPSGAASRAGRFALPALGVILAIGLVARLREAQRTPLWFDEIFTLWMTRASFGAMLERLASDIHPPLMSVLLWAWRGAGGEGVLWLKALPIAIGLATLVALHAAARDWFGERAGLLAALLLALQPTHVYFSQELRSYALLILAALLATWTAWRWVRRGGRGNGIAFVASAALALYTHYLAALLLAFLGGWGLVTLWPDRRRMRSWALWNAAVALAFLPQFPTFLHQLGLAADHWMKPPGFQDLDNLSRKMAFSASYMVPVLAVIAAVPLLRQRSRREAILLWLMIAAPVATAYALTRADVAKLFVERYMHFTLPFLCALLAAGIVGARHPALAVVLAIALTGFAARQTVMRRPYAEAVALDAAVRSFERHRLPGDVVFCADSHSLFVMEHRHPAADVRLVVTWERVPYYEGATFIPDSMRTTPAAVAAAARGGRRWWGLRTRHGGISSAAGAALMDSLARGGRDHLDMVTIWAGQPAMRGGDVGRGRSAPDGTHSR